MEISNLGLSFVPDERNLQAGRRGTEAANIPQALKILSLRLPSIRGSGTPTPPELLQANPAAPASPITAVVESILQQVLGGQAGAAGPAGGGAEMQALQGAVPQGRAWARPVISYQQPGKGPTPPLPRAGPFSPEPWTRSVWGMPPRGLSGVPEV